MAEADRRARALARATRAVLHRTRLQDREHDLDPIRGPEAVSLVDRLTRESWSAAGLPYPTYERSEIPVRFVPRRRD
jgi:hypothetical protein